MNLLIATLMIALQYAGYLLLLTIALAIVTHFAKSTIEHHHKTKAAAQMMVNATTAGDGGQPEQALQGLLSVLRHAREAQEAAERNGTTGKPAL